MGAKKNGLTTTEDGQELFISLKNLENADANARISREKIFIDVVIDTPTKVTLKGTDQEIIYTTVIEPLEDKAKNHLRIILASAPIGIGHFLLTEDMGSNHKKQIYMEAKK
ncbi:MAG: hypothetical protein MJZ23_01130 [Paludibacteraceae bacterium]|nr:hypothetical protein [Paludibacteraceae bacterium]